VHDIAQFEVLIFSNRKTNSCSLTDLTYSWTKSIQWCSLECWKVYKRWRETKNHLHLPQFWWWRR